MIKLLRALRAAGVAVLAVGMLLGIAHLSVADPDPAKNDEPKKEEPKKGEVKKEEPQKEVTNEELRKFADQLRQEMENLRRDIQKSLGEVRRGGGGIPAPVPVPRFFRPGQGGRLGVSVDWTGEVLADQLNLEKNVGLLITDVGDESAAAKAGLKAHDVLVELGGKPVPNNPGEFVRMIDDAKANTPMDAVVIRKGKRETIKGITLPEARPIRRSVLPRPGRVLYRPVTVCR